MRTAHLTPSRRRGLTKIEVVVTVGVVLVVAWLLLPAIYVTREGTSRRRNCINNQRNIGIALINYESSKKALPGWVVPQIPRSASPSPRAASWVYPLLPALDREDIYNEFGVKGNLSNMLPGVYPAGSMPASTMTDELHLKILICPNDTTALGQGANISYVVNAGMSDVTTFDATTQAALYGPGVPGATSPFQEPFASGMFHNNYFSDDPTRGASTTVSSLAGIADGAANTLLLGENVDAGKWIDADEGAVTFCWFPVDPAQAASPDFDLRINRGIGNEGKAPRASSYHPGGVVVTFCDGHSTFVDENIDYMTWCLLFTPRGRDLKFAPHDSTSSEPPADLSETLFKPRGYTKTLHEKF